MQSYTFRPTQRVRSSLFPPILDEAFSSAISVMNEQFRHDIKEIEMREAENDRLAGIVKFETTTLSLLN